ncbi:hypothetical protein LJC63_12765 [Ruminococcaceae bacterium OttesenSCG-928-L11]|nr:hypothetical protein [Ruminococcaceae bacterium OttesenSCG-928-L11]
MRAAVFAGRNTKEMMRNPASLLCGIGVPVLLLAVLSTMKRLIPTMADNFEISNMAPGMVVFSLSFLSTFLGVLMVSDMSNQMRGREIWTIWETSMQRLATLKAGLMRKYTWRILLVLCVAPATMSSGCFPF